MNTDLIPLPEHREKVYKVEGDTQDIIDVVLKAAKTKHNKEFCKFAEQFSKDEQGLRQLWSFVKYKITYQKDDDGRQDILLPAALWFRGWGDCKSKTVFIAHVLQCLKIPYIIRFTTYYSSGNYTHVYPIAILKGKSVIIDTVFDFFDREKTYVKKLDYPMTKISMISGFNEPDIDKYVKEKVTVIEQKRSLISEQEPVELKDKKVGDVRAMLLRRQLQLLKVFNSDDSKKVVEYNKAINVLDKAIVKGVRNYKAIGGTDTIEIAVNNLINTRLKDNRPAMSFNNTMAGKMAKIGGLPSSYQNLYIEGTNDVDIRKSILRQKADKSWVYKMGADTPYEVPFSKIVPILNKYVKEERLVSYNPKRYRTPTNEILDMRFSLKDNLFTPLANKITKSLYGWNDYGWDNNTMKYNGMIVAPANISTPNFPAETKRLTGITDYNSYRNYLNNSQNQLFRQSQVPLVYEYINEMIANNPNTMYLWNEIGTYFNAISSGYSDALANYGVYNKNERTEGNNPPRAFLKFTSYEAKLNFEKYVEEKSGVWDKFLNERVFKEQNKIGCSLLYNWCDKVPNANMNMYSNLVTSKSVIQSQYMEGINYLTGADSTIVNDMARNTAIVGFGKNPEDQLDELLYATGKKPAIGEPISAIITAIVAAVATILATVIPLCKQTQNDAKKDADDLSPNKAMGMTPIGDGLMPNMNQDFIIEDKNGTGSPDGTNNNNDEPTSSGLDTNTMLGLGIAAAGAYFLLNKKSKK